MTAKIIAVTNQKGGSGKTTVSMQLGGALARTKKFGRVLIVDADPQGTAVRWAASAPEDQPFPADVFGLSAAGGKVHQEVKKYIDKYDWIIIDCPPAVDSAVPQSALLIADLAIVPIIPSPPDLWAGVGIRELITRIGSINENLQSRLIANMCQPNTTLAREAMDVLDDFGVPLSNSRLHLRTIYRQSAVFGGTVFELGKKAEAAIDEMQRLAKEVRSLVGFPTTKGNQQ